MYYFIRYGSEQTFEGTLNWFNAVKDYFNPQILNHEKEKKNPTLTHSLV